MTSALANKVGWAVGGVILGVLLALALLNARPDPGAQPTSFAARALPDLKRQTAPVAKPESTENLAQYPQTLQEILQIPGDFTQTAALYQLAVSLEADRILELLDEARTLRPASDGRAASSILYSRYAELDPEAAVDRLLRRVGPNEAAWLGQVFHVWARADLDAAVGKALGLRMQHRLTAGMGILQARDDLPTAERESIARQLGLPGGLPQLDAQRQLSSVDDPAVAWSEALEVRNRLDQDRRLTRLAEIWGRMDPAAAMEAVENLDRANLRQQLKGQVLRHWSNGDIDGAVDWVLAQPASRDRASQVTSTLATLTMSDPARAMELTGVLTGLEHQRAVASVLGAWSQMDPRAAAQSMATVQDPVARSLAAGQIGRSYARQYPDEAAQWLAELDPADADQAAAGIIRTLARQDPAAAGELVLGITDPAQMHSAASQLLSRWVRAAPEEAVRWTSEIEDSGLRARLYQNFLPQMAFYDGAAAVRYVERIEDVAEREAVAGAVLLSTRDPELMERLYEGLTLPDTRRSAAITLYRYWLQADPDRAPAYLQASGLTEAEAAEMPSSVSNLTIHHESIPRHLGTPRRINNQTN